MNRRRIIIAAIVVGLLLAVIALVLLRAQGGANGDESANPTATITTAVVRSQGLQSLTSVYGIVQADPAASTTLAAPRAVIVIRVLVLQGQAVSAGQPLVEIASTPGSDLAYRQAADAATAAAADLTRTQRLFDERLVASDQLTAAKKGQADAQAALVALQRQGSGQAHQTLLAPQAAVVTSIAAAPGDHLGQDAPLLVLARQGALSVKLGVEPSAGFLAVGQVVNIRPLAGGAPITTHLTMVGRAADPTTKTLDAVAALEGAALPIGSGVQADIVTGAHVGLAVPRAAVVFDETGDHVFVVEGGKARRVFVTVGRDYGDQLEVSGPITAGQTVAVQGAAELQDGMAVKVASR